MLGLGLLTRRAINLPTTGKDFLVDSETKNKKTLNKFQNSHVLRQ